MLIVDGFAQSHALAWASGFESHSHSPITIHYPCPNRPPARVKWPLMNTVVKCAICLMNFPPILALTNYLIEYNYRKENMWITPGQGWKHTRTNCASGTRRFCKIASNPFCSLLQVSDSGVYLCKGVNGFGSAQAQIELLVSGAGMSTTFSFRCLLKICRNWGCFSRAVLLSIYAFCLNASDCLLVGCLIVIGLTLLLVYCIKRQRCRPHCQTIPN